MEHEISKAHEISKSFGREICIEYRIKTLWLLLILLLLLLFKYMNNS